MTTAWCDGSFEHSNSIPQMSALYLLVLASIVVAGFFLMAFIWSVRSNQYEDKQGAAIRMLQDDEIKSIN
jgi:cbb3-type cytochrome oxidase maturation protein